MFDFLFHDNAEAERRSAAAWTEARRIAALHPSTNWPDVPPIIPTHLTAEVRQILNEIYFYGVLYGGAETTITAGVDGLTVRSPALGMDDKPRHVSWETLLPFPDTDVAPATAKALAARLRGLAAICDIMAQRPARRVR